MPRPLKVGGDVDSWCTKCRMMLTHRIVAMVGPKPARVECETCHSQHNWRERAPGDAPVRETRIVGSSSGSGPRAPRVSHVTKLEQERRDREKSWEHAVTRQAGGRLHQVQREDAVQGRRPREAPEVRRRRRHADHRRAQGRDLVQGRAAQARAGHDLMKRLLPLLLVCAAFLGAGDAAAEAVKTEATAPSALRIAPSFDGHVGRVAPSRAVRVGEPRPQTRQGRDDPRPARRGSAEARRVDAQAHGAPVERRSSTNAGALDVKAALKANPLANGSDLVAYAAGTLHLAHAEKIYHAPRQRRRRSRQRRRQGRAPSRRGPPAARRRRHACRSISRRAITRSSSSCTSATARGASAFASSTTSSRRPRARTWSCPASTRRSAQALARR